MRQRSRPVHLLLAAAVLGTAATALSAGPAQATGETTLTADPLSTWQTDGIVWAMAYAKGIVYVGGTFSHIRPPGAAPGTGEVARTNFAAFDAKTGEPLPCAPAFTGGTGTIRAMKASPDGSMIYIGGSFGKAGSVGRSNTAALDTADCTIGADWKPTVSSTVRAIDVTDDAVYLGGGFATVQGQTRERIAALRPDSTLLPFKATIRGSSIGNDPTPGVNAITVAPQLNKVIIGGRFTSVNGSLFGVHALAGLDATTGKVVNSFTGWIPNRSAVKTLVNDGTNFYTGTEGTGGGVFDGRQPVGLHRRRTSSGGTPAWAPPRRCCRTRACSTAARTPTTAPAPRASSRTSTPPAPAGAVDLRHDLLPWFPDTNDGIGEQIGPRALTAADGILWVGGEFTTVNDAAAAGPHPVRGGPGHRGAAGAAAQRREQVPGQDHAELEGLVGPGRRRPDLQDLPRRHLSDLARPGLALLEPARHELHGHRGARVPAPLLDRGHRRHECLGSQRPGLCDRQKLTARRVGGK